MANPHDTNEAVWKSDETIKHWSSMAAGRERKRAEAVRLIAQLLPFEEHAEFTLLDLGAGTGMAARGVMDYYPRAQAILADYSPQMMGEGEKILQPYAGRYRYVEFDMQSSDWPAAIPAQLDAAVTSQCVHHLPDERKQSLFREILERLKPGAWYVNFDPVRGPDLLVEETWQRVNDLIDPEAAHRRTHREPHEQAMWENHVRYMIDLDTQLGFFRSAGFEAVDVYWKQLDYVIYGGRKPRT
ncbi:MAG: class I SAM-dependent methyltransferase [Chloroflexota bacterium]|nr:class I SAM-dependent methyltransferase [Chloroflexota bacterium]